MIEFLHGDCRELLPIEADVIITDPPYAVDKKGEMLGQLSSNYHEKGTHSRGYADHDRTQFGLLLTPVFSLLLGSVPPGASMIAFCGNRTFHQMAHFAEEAGWQMLDVLSFQGGGSFAKSKTTLMPRHELAMWMRKPGGVRLVNPDRNIGNVVNLTKGRSESAHPTTKPQAWMERVVEIFSNPGDTILDPFAGSASTLIAARSLGRSAVGIELVRDYYEIGLARLGD